MEMFSALSTLGEGYRPVTGGGSPAQKPVTRSFDVFFDLPLNSNNSRMHFTVISHTLARSHFYHTHIMYKRNWDGSCLINLIYF